MSNRRRPSRGRPKPPRRADFHWPNAADDAADAADLARQSREVAISLAVDMAAAAFVRPTDTPPTAVELGRRAIVGHLQGRLFEHINAGGMVACEHLNAEGGDALWLPHIPNALICGDCLATAPRPFDCSHCGRRTPLALERWVITAGPTTVVAFLCPRCVATTRPEGAQ